MRYDKQLMAKKNPQVVVIAGPNGSGKTTLAPVLLRDTFGLMEYVDADPIARGLSSFEPEAVAFEAGRIMLRRIHSLGYQRVSFAFESTLASRSYAPWIQQLKQHAYSFHLLFLWLRSPALAVRRVQERVRAGGHNVPEETVRRRYYRGISNFFNLYQRLADTWAVYDNSTLGSTALIAQGVRNTRPTIVNGKLWGKFFKESK